jgi:hypothetical protein
MIRIPPLAIRISRPAIERNVSRLRDLDRYRHGGASRRRWDGLVASLAMFSDSSPMGRRALQGSPLATL